MNHEQKFIEIPFGAKDSELKGWEYTIPDGMEAIVKDGKVIVREKESEDERMRKAALEGIEHLERNLGWDAIGDIDILDVKEYLEKLKENPKSADSIPSDLVPDAKLANKILTDAIVALSNTVDYNCSEPLIYKKEIDNIKFLREEIEKQKQQKSCSKGGILPLDYYQGIMEGRSDVIDHPEQFGLQKPAEWSEVDQRILADVEWLINESDWPREDKDVHLSLLNSLRPVKQEWSEDDEKMRKDTLRSLECYQKMFTSERVIEDVNDEIFWLKSLRPQPKEDKFQDAMRMADKFEEGYEAGMYDTKAKAWKPSKEQLDALKEASVSWMNETMGNAKILNSLYEQLKAL